MPDQSGISRSGKDAEDRFIVLTGAKATTSKARGDAVLDGREVEVKRVKKTTINQVRPLKYLPLVLYQWTTDRWFVIPAHRIVLDTARKTRGQHTEIAFESVDFSLKSYEAFECSPEDLRSTVLARAEEADQYPKLKEAMESLLAELQTTARSHREKVATILREYGL